MGFSEQAEIKQTKSNEAKPQMPALASIWGFKNRALPHTYHIESRFNPNLDHYNRSYIKWRPNLMSTRSAQHSLSL